MNDQEASSYTYLLDLNISRVLSTVTQWGMNL